MPIITHRLTILLLFANYVFAYRDNLFYKKVEYTRREGYLDVEAAPCPLFNWFERKLKWKGYYDFDQYVIPLENDLYLGTIRFECKFKYQFRDTNEILLMTYNQTTVYKAKDLRDKPSKDLCSWKSQFFFEAQESENDPDTLCMVDNYHIRYKTSKGAFKPKFGCGTDSDSNIEIPKLCFKKPQAISPTKPAIPSISSVETDLIPPAISTPSQSVIQTASFNPPPTVSSISSAPPEPVTPPISSNSSQSWVSFNPSEAVLPTSSTNESPIPPVSLNSKESTTSSISPETFSLDTSASTKSSSLAISASSITVAPIIPTASSNLFEPAVSSDFFNSSQHVISTFDSTLSEPVSLPTLHPSVPVTSFLSQSVIQSDFFNSSLSWYPTFSSSHHESISSSISLSISSTVSSFLPKTVPSNSTFLQSVIASITSLQPETIPSEAIPSQSVSFNSSVLQHVNPSLSSTLQSSNLSSSIVLQPVVPPLFSNSSQSISSTLHITHSSILSPVVIPSASSTDTKSAVPESSTPQKVVSSISTSLQPVKPTVGFSSSELISGISSGLSAPVLPTYSLHPVIPPSSFTLPSLKPSISTLSQPVVPPLYSNSSQPVISSSCSIKPESVLSTSTLSQLVISSIFSVSSLVNPPVSSILPTQTLPIIPTSRESVETIPTSLPPVISSFNSFSSTQGLPTFSSSQLINPTVDSTSYKPVLSVSSSVHTPVPLTSTPSKHVISSKSSQQSILVSYSTSFQTKTSSFSSTEPKPILSISSGVHRPVPITSTLSQSIPPEIVTSNTSNLGESISLTSSILPNTVLTITSTLSEPDIPSVSSTSLEFDTTTSSDTPSSAALEAHIITITSSQHMVFSTPSNPYQTATISSLLNSLEKVSTSTPAFDDTKLSSSLNLFTIKTLFSNADKLTASIDFSSSIYPSFLTSDSSNYDTFKTHGDLTPYITSSTDLTSISISSTYYTTKKLIETTTEIISTTLTTIVATTVRDDEVESISLIISTTSEVTHTFTTISTYAINDSVLSSQLPQVYGSLSSSSVTVDSTLTMNSNIPPVNLAGSSASISATLSLNDISAHLAGTIRLHSPGRLIMLLAVLFF